MIVFWTTRQNSSWCRLKVPPLSGGRVYVLIKALAQWKHAEVKRKASKARLPSFSHVLPLRHYWQKAWSLLKQRLVIELIDVVGSSDNMEELWSGRKVKSCFGNLSLSCIPKLSRSVHSWTDHTLVLAEWIKNSQFPALYEMRLHGVMVIVFIISDWTFVLMNTLQECHREATRH